MDVILHPLKSELNFPVGQRHDLDFSPKRWDLPIHLLDAIFFAERLTMSVDFRESSRAKALLDDLRLVLDDGYAKRALQKSPHIVLLDAEWYHEVCKPLLARWCVLWLEKNHLVGLSEEDVVAYILHGANYAGHRELADKYRQLAVEAREWAQVLRTDKQHVIIMYLLS